MNGELIEVALGQRQADLYISGGKIVIFPGYRRSAWLINLGGGLQGRY